ncbi:hypothetical protein [Micromonospora zhanjiangensis]
MSELLTHALTVDVAAATAAAVAAAVDEASQQADRLLGGRPVPGSARWTAEDGTPTAADREVAAQVVRLRIELAAGLDPIGSLVGLRRWG